MSLASGNNQIKIQVIDSNNDEVRFEANWYNLDYQSTVLLQEAFTQGAIELGKKGVELLKAAESKKK